MATTAITTNTTGEGGWGSSSSNNSVWGSNETDAGWEEWIKNQKPCGWTPVGVDGSLVQQQQEADNQQSDENLENDGRTTTTDDFLSEDRPFIPKSIGVPKNALSWWYGKRHKDISFTTNHQFTTWHDEGLAHELHFTSVFQCPVTGELFSSGRWGHESTYKVVEENVETMEEDEEKVDMMGKRQTSVIWYCKKSLAEHAAAARALDCLSFREGNGVPSMSFCICIEKPYMMACEAPPISSSAPSTLDNQIDGVTMDYGGVNFVDGDKNISMSGGVHNNDDFCSGEDYITLQPTAMRTPNPASQTPKSIVHSWYAEYHKDVDYTKRSCYITWHDESRPDNDMRFTSMFQCPVTNEMFASGRYGSASDYEVVEHSAAKHSGTQEEEGDDIMDTISEFGSVVWYRKKAFAERAAAARVFDCFVFRDVPGISTILQRCSANSTALSTSSHLCEEAPYNEGDTPPLPASLPSLLQI